MSCTNCNKTPDNCGCEQKALHISQICNPINCPVEECSESLSAGCIIYTGDDLICDTTVLATSGDTVAQIMANIAAYFCIYLNRVLNGIADPTVNDGRDGDFYINTTTWEIFGPKAAGVWPVGVSLIGPQGPQGIQGPIGDPGYLRTFVNIGDWNMVLTNWKSVLHGIADFTKIVAVQVVIINDAGTFRYMLNSKQYPSTTMDGSVQLITSGAIQIERTTSGFFDSVDFDSVGYNRGIVTIDYLP
tara:strand:- start:19048 stop:19782 length:735 start_codon:yes stop_codon:yes gene_type:complete